MLYHPISDVLVMEPAIVGDGEVLYLRTYQLEVAPVPVPMTMEAGTEDPSGLCKVDGFPAMLAADQERAKALSAPPVSRPSVLDMNRCNGRRCARKDRARTARSVNWRDRLSGWCDALRVGISSE